MMRVRFWFCALLLACASFWSAPARAETAPRVAFAVVVGNNRALLGRRPELHYADDDAARYFEILRTVAGERTFLLTDFDRDSARLFPALVPVARAPTRAALERLGRELADRVHKASLEGHPTDLYFVFAGHGDVDEGSGFIELADARFTAADLEAWLQRIPFSRAHVILDSCNSFFMLGVRKPGGHYFPTPEDAARSLATRLPNVGVFLSTSAEGETFEWSETQSGIFSHVVRSGLLGAGDADGDGLVSYLELAAFVATATADVKNPNLRPHVFSRGPAADDRMPILHLAPRTGARDLRVSDRGPLRVRLRDREGLLLLDANLEQGVPLRLVLPVAWAEGASLERLRPARAGGSPELAAFALPPEAERIELANLDSPPPSETARGPGDVFRKLFARPYGPRAVASYVAESRRAAPVAFGVSRADAARMALLLDEIDAAERTQRMATGIVSVGIGAVLGATGASFIVFDDRLSKTRPRGADIAGVFYASLGGAALLFGGHNLLIPWAGEQAAADYRAALRGGDYARAFAAADRRLPALEARERRSRWVRGTLGGIWTAAATAAIIATELSPATPEERLSARAIGGTIFVIGSSTLLSAILLESPVERLTRVWHRDPGLLQLRPTLEPTARGTLFGLTGRF